MVVFELPSIPRGAGPRAVSLGSCRVHGPLAALADRGNLRLCAIRRLFSYTASEALQTLEFVAGDKAIPQTLDPYLYGAKAPLDPGPFRWAMNGGVDVSIVEISHDRQFSYGDVFLQSTFLSSHLVRPHGSALLPWFRELSSGRGVDEIDVQEAAEALRRGQFECDEQLLDLLRGVKFERQSVATIEEALGAMMSRIGGRWIVVGPVVLADHDGAIMRDRRALSAKLEQAAKRCGAILHDPSHLVSGFGRAVALDAGGADIFEYAPDFRATVGEALIDELRSPLSRRKPRSPRRSAKVSRQFEFSSRSKLAERINAELIGLHRERLARMGAEASGIYRYETLLKRDTLLGLRERAMLELIETYLPAYHSYGVMRAGLGEAALLLAASGRKVIAYEPNANRRSAIEAGREHLQAAGLMTGGSMTVAAALTPTRDLGIATLGVGLNVGLTADDVETGSHLQGMAAFDALLIDPEFFYRAPDNGPESARLAESLDAIGFGDRRDYPADHLAWIGR